MSNSIKTIYNIKGSEQDIKELADKLYMVDEGNKEFVFHRLLDIPSDLYVTNTEMSRKIMDFIREFKYYTSELPHIDSDDILSLDLHLFQTILVNTSKTDEDGEENYALSSLLMAYEAIDPNMDILYNIVSSDEFKDTPYKRVSDLIKAIDSDSLSLIEKQLNNESNHGYYNALDFFYINVGCFPKTYHCEQEIKDNEITGSFYTTDCAPVEFFSNLTWVDSQITILDVDSGENHTWSLFNQDQGIRGKK